MGKRGRLYSPEFMEKAVRLVHTSEERYPVAKIARDLDVSAETLRNWVNQAQIDAGEREGLTIEEREELRSLRKEVKVLKEKCEMSKKRRWVQPVSATVLDSVAAGVLYPRVLRGLLLSLSVIRSRSCWPYTERSLT